MNEPLGYAGQPLAQAQRDKQFEFWRSHLRGAPALLELPADRARPATRTRAGESVGVQLSAELTAGLRTLAQRHGSDVLVTLLAGWSVLLARLSGQAEVVLGTLVANRQDAGVRPLIGRAANVLALRIGLGTDPTVAELLAQVKASLLDASAHQDLSFEELLEAAAAERNPSCHPLFQAKLSLYETPDHPAPQVPGLELEREVPPRDGTLLNLNLSLKEDRGCFAGELAYSSDLFERDTALRLIDGFVAVLGDMVGDAGARVNSISLMSLIQREQVLHGFNATRVPVPERRTIHELFEEQARSQPDAPAVRCEGQTLSYAALNARANQVAHRLIALGVKPDDRVALYAERRLSTIVGLLGALKAGAAYVPLDPGYPPERLAHMLDDSSPIALLTRASLDTKLPLPPGVPALVMDDGSLEALPTFDPQTSVTSRNLAYIIYTSGSTGTPKGVMVEHRSAVNFWQVMGKTTHAECAPRSNVALNAAFSFDMSLKGILQLLSGHCLVLIPQEIRASGPALLAFLEEERIDAFDSTPSQLQGLLDAGLLESGRHRPGSVLLGGEAIGRAMWERLKQARLIHFHNMYGPTEATVDAAIGSIREASGGPSIGRPIANAQIYVLDERRQPVPIGVPGEIYIGGLGVARGYLNRPELTAERFVPNSFGTDPSLKLYKTGDLGRWRADGTLEYLGRNDFQVKIRGFRIELGEIEARLTGSPGIREAVVLAREDAPGSLRLVAYLRPEEGRSPAILDLRNALATTLPEYMVPAAFVLLDAFPLTANGKVDRNALPKPEAKRPEWAAPWQAPQGASEAQICAVFESLLPVAPVGRDDNFFEFGGNSLLAIQALARIAERTGLRISGPTFFANPTAASLAQHAAAGQGAAQPSPTPLPQARTGNDQSIAIIAMAGRFPGANDVESFWDNLLEGRDGIRFFDDATLDADVSSALRDDPAYVRARGVIDGVEQFDPAFFGINPKEAELMDPQQRLFLEICWECLERGGYAPDRCPMPVGVYAGMGNSTYFRKHLAHRPELIEALGEFQVMLANEKDYIATRVAYRLNLHGPAVNIQAACATSLVAVHSACQALRSRECDMALAGGVSITCPPASGYLYQEGAMFSPDGRTRTFDAQARGTVFSDGAGVVLIKRLSDALRDGDPIYAVLRGSAINNDGGSKASFTAPSVDGQATVIGSALANAGVTARSISYVEAHGTATPMGDPVEIEALTRAYRRHTQDVGFCRIGSVKSNVGHLTKAAGAAGLIKTALALHDEQLPPSIHFESPNPSIDFDATPFVVNDQCRAWPRGSVPRRAGVSAFGVGGANAHVIVEEAPLPAPSEIGEGPSLLQVSARTPTALAAACGRLAAHLEANPEISMADVAHTLRVGRTPFAYRTVVAVETAAQATQALRAADSPARASGATGARTPQPVFMFPGQGAQYAGMGQSLYASSRAHRAAFDECLQCFEGVLPFDLRERMFSPDPSALAPTSVTQPATFTLEYVLAVHLRSLGVEPAALVGHSVGEFAAAVLAGVMSLQDAARLVARRGALMQAQPAGSMLSVRLPAEQLLSRLPSTLSLAAENGPNVCVAAGPTEEIERLRAALEADGVVAKLLQTSHAFHSAMMEPAVPLFEALVREMELKAPSLPIYSTLTGRLLGAQEATDPHYWARHLREMVRFSPAIREVMAQLDNPLFVEIGPRNTLATLVRQHASKERPANAISVLVDNPGDEERSWRLAAGRLWTLGAEIDLAPLDARTHKRRLCLPTYPFERKRVWVDIAATVPAPSHPIAAVSAATATLVPVAPPVLPEPTTMPAATIDRRPAIAQRLRALFEDISGIDLAAAEGSTSFVEMGLDSLTLTQAALQVKKSFKVDLTFRQLMQNYRSFDALGEFLDANLPPELVTTPPAAAQVQVAAPVVSPIAMPETEGSLLKQVIAQQMQLMQQHLALLSGAAAVATPAPAAAPVVSTAPTASPAPVAELAAPIHAPGKEMTERQKARLSAFVRRYMERTRKSKEFAIANRPRMADPRAASSLRLVTGEIDYPIVVDRSKGSRLWDLDGNEYVDALNGFGMNLFGWQPDFVQEAVRGQLERGYETGPQHPLAAEVTQLACELTGFDRAALYDTSNEAVMAAIRIARAVTGRNTVVQFTGSRGGLIDGVRALNYGSPEALEFIRANMEDLAAVFVEPVQGHRLEFQPREFLHELRAMTEKGGTCLIFDEFTTGFRSHAGGAQAIFGIRADLSCFGKVIGGGFPLAMVAGTHKWMDGFDWGSHDDGLSPASTSQLPAAFGRHPLALSACKASLMHLKESGETLQAQLTLHTAAMADELTAFCREVGAPIAIRHFTSIWCVTWLEEHPFQDLLFAMMRSRGVHILRHEPCFMTAAHTQQDIALVKSSFKESVSEMQAAEFLSGSVHAARSTMDAAMPPFPDARLGRDRDGQPAWFVPDPRSPGKFKRLEA